jgi:hypothetical protein
MVSPRVLERSITELFFIAIPAKQTDKVSYGIPISPKVIGFW